MIESKINYYLGKKYNIEYNYIAKVLIIHNKIFVYELPIIRKIIEVLRIDVKNIRVEG